MKRTSLQQLNYLSDKQKVVADTKALKLKKFAN